jgi:hypothetical protein
MCRDPFRDFLEDRSGPIIRGVGRAGLRRLRKVYDEVKAPGYYANSIGVQQCIADVQLSRARTDLGLTL